MRALAIANSRGVPGTATALVCDPSGRRMLLANHHVIFGGGAAAGERIWALPDADESWSTRRDAVPLGCAARGQLGPVADGFVDCALIELDGALPPWVEEALRSCLHPAAGPAAKGALVFKEGAATGHTEGVLVDAAHVDRPYIEGRRWDAQGQLLVSARDSDLNFSTQGDSGAALVGESGALLGLLWGANSGGQGIACPIAAVLDCLQVTLLRRRT